MTDYKYEMMKKRRKKIARKRELLQQSATQAVLRKQGSLEQNHNQFRENLLHNLSTGGRCNPKKLTEPHS